MEKEKIRIEHIPIFGSIDIRQDSNGRVVAIDPNRYPQGFNNVSKEDIKLELSQGTAPKRDRLTFSQDGATLLERRLDRESQTGNCTYDRLHVVQENYPDPLHPYYQNLSCLIGLLQNVFPTKKITHSVRRVMNFDPARHQYVSSGCATIQDELGSGVSGDLIASAAPLKASRNNNVYNILNTSYPCDMLDPLEKKEWAETPQGEVFFLSRTGGKSEKDKVDLTDDPALYNSKKKSELYTFINSWMKECPIALLKDLDIPLDQLDVSLTRRHDNIQPEVEAGFDVFSQELSLKTQDSLAALITKKLIPTYSGHGKKREGWGKVFVKDDSGCNACGICVFGNEHLESTVSRKSVGSKLMPVENRKIVLTGTQRKSLRVRNQTFREKESKENIRYVLQEGISTNLINSETGAQLEVVLMCIDGKAFSYFVREAPVEISNEEGIHRKQKDEKALRAKASGAEHEQENSYQVLNTSEARFVSPYEFETLAKYADASTNVQQRWTRYLLSGTLCMLALAKQKQMWADKSRRENDMTKHISMQNNCAVSVISLPRIQESSLQQQKQQEQVQLKWTAEKFSRSLSGKLLKTLNSLPNKWKITTFTAECDTKAMQIKKKYTLLKHFFIVVKKIRVFLHKSFGNSFNYAGCGNLLLREIIVPPDQESLWTSIATIIVKNACSDIIAHSAANSPPMMPQTENGFQKYDGVSQLLLRLYVQLQACFRGLICGDKESLEKLARNGDQFTFTTIPFTLQPSIFSYQLRESLIEVVGTVGIVNSIYDAVITDVTFLLKELEKVAKSDHFISGLLQIVKDVYIKGGKSAFSDPRLHLFRHDYLPHDENKLKHVEVNTIAVAFAGFSSEVANMHEATMEILPPYAVTPSGTQCLFEPLNQFSSGGITNAYACGLSEAHASYCARYDHLEAKICFLCFDNDHLDLDQRMISKALQKYDLKPDDYFSCTWETAQIECEEIDGKLLVDKNEVSVVFFHTTYSPDHFIMNKDWIMKMVIEKSRAVKVPSVLGQLAGTKKIQQAMTERPALRHFVKQSQKGRDCDVDDIVDQLLSFSLKQVDTADATGDSLAMIHDALEAPQNYVLKPQREGGGNNFFGEELKDRLKHKLRNEHKITSCDTLVEKIKSQPLYTTAGLLEKDGTIFGESTNPRVVSEFGVFTSYFTQGSDCRDGFTEGVRNNASNHVGGVFCRTKLAKDNEGGVCAGHGFLDTPWFAALSGK